MNFPIISKLSDLLPHIEGNKQIRVKTEDNGLTVVCYMVQDEDTFAGADLEYAVECRGITFDTNGKIVARTLHKFFNVGEHDSVRPENLDWSKVTRIMEKRDGSMVTPVRIDEYGNFAMKTKKTFGSKEASLAQDLAMEITRYNWIKKVLLDGFTPTFEVTSPKFPIVIKYDKDELTLLHVRENITGRYLSERELQSWTPPFPIVENLMQEFVGVDFVAWDYLRHAAETREGIEGWVIQFENGDMVKLKTAWYCKLHHAVTFTRWRDIARTVAADQSDDLKGAFAMTGRSIEPILQVERGIKRAVDAARDQVTQIAEEGRAQSKSAKDMAMMYGNHSMFGMIMREFRRQELDWMAWYVKNRLEEDWGLEVVEVDV